MRTSITYSSPAITLRRFGMLFFLLIKTSLRWQRLSCSPALSPLKIGLFALPLLGIFGNNVML
jgi:hypothetical protein